MPLRAILAGREILAPLLTGYEWEQLRQQAREQPGALVLPCCQQPGGLRVSRLGTRHFVHRPGAPCARTGETFQHLKLKADIVLACQAAGFAATTEVAGDDWRADVLASDGAARIAFEVQWSQQDLATTEYRQERYRRAGIRACWFFRKLPGGGRRPPRRDLPMFQVEWQAETASGLALVNGRRVELGEAVAALLGRKIRWCPAVREAGRQPVQLYLSSGRCGRCGAESRWYALPASLRSGCGLDVPGDPLAAARPELLAAIAGGAAEGALGAGPPLAPLASDADPLTGRPRWIFRCPGCQAAFRPLIAWTPRTRPAAGGSPAASLAIVMELAAPRQAARPHWCWPGDSRFCDRPAPD